MEISAQGFICVSANQRDIRESKTLVYHCLRFNGRAALLRAGPIRNAKGREMKINNVADRCNVTARVDGRPAGRRAHPLRHLRKCVHAKCHYALGDNACHSHDRRHFTNVDSVYEKTSTRSPLRDITTKYIFDECFCERKRGAILCSYRREK